jgi:lipopolysaccharide heptosyltransferase II
LVKEHHFFRFVEQFNRLSLIDFNNINEILIIRLSSLGDILLSTPLIRSIKKKFPHITIDYLLREEYKDVLINNPYINKLFLFKRNENSFSDELASDNYDLIIDLQNNIRSASIRNKIKSGSVRIFNKRTLDKLLLVKFKINNLKEAKQIPIRYAESIDGFELDEEGLDLFTGIKKASINGKEKDYIGFAPGSRHFTKSWPEDYYISLGKKLSDEGKTVVLFGGKEGMKICEEISKSIFNSIDLSNNSNLLQTATNMKECKAVVCNDSGLMHTACAMKVPVLALFGSTVKEFGFTPYKNSNLILENKTLSCRPCTHIGRENCPKKHFKCMLELSPSDAYNKLIELINS